MSDNVEARRRALLDPQRKIEHFDITHSHTSQSLLDAYAQMGMSARYIARARRVWNAMLSDQECTIFLAIAGSTSAFGCVDLYSKLVAYRMVDAVVATGATIWDMDVYEALGGHHFQGSWRDADDATLGGLEIDRITDTFIDERNLKHVDRWIADQAKRLAPRTIAGYEFIDEAGRVLADGTAAKKGSLVETAHLLRVPVTSLAFMDSSAGLGFVFHRRNSPAGQQTIIDQAADFDALTRIKEQAGTTGMLVIGGGTPFNTVQDTVVCAEMCGTKVPMHEYGIKITTADERDGGCSGSTLREARSWGKTDFNDARMVEVFADATCVLPILASTVYHDGLWRSRAPRRWLEQL